ncbi:hypothetical protein ATY27_08760 [Rheinheimera sp. F8]|nr:hypothetical protein ATY27_05940 [Rheinheimera sp. F8]ALZ75847.1 hypothetical protein ATY27_08760 [Rheinheimera sp. F8]
MQGKRLINHRILTAFSTGVALKNCNYQLQNLELSAFTSPVAPTSVALATYQLLKSCHRNKLVLLEYGHRFRFFCNYRTETGKCCVINACFQLLADCICL